MSYSKDTKDILFILGMTIVVLIVVSGVGWGLHSLGVFGNTVVERKVFENSHQYHQARKQELVTYQAQLAEIDQRLRDPDLDPNIKKSLEAQRATIVVLLNAAEAR